MPTGRLDLRWEGKTYVSGRLYSYRESDGLTYLDVALSFDKSNAEATDHPHPIPAADTTLAEVIAGRASARLRPDQTVLYIELGIFPWDNALATFAYTWPPNTVSAPPSRCEAAVSGVPVARAMSLRVNKDSDAANMGSLHCLRDFPR